MNLLAGVMLMQRNERISSELENIWLVGMDGRVSYVLGVEIWENALGKDRVST